MHTYVHISQKCEDFRMKKRWVQLQPARMMKVWSYRISTRSQPLLYVHTESFGRFQNVLCCLILFLYKKWHIESIYKWWVQLLFFLIHSYRPPFFSPSLYAAGIAWILISIKRRIEKIIVSDFFSLTIHSILTILNYLRIICVTLSLSHSLSSQKN